MPEEMFSFLKRFCSNGLLKELKAVLLVRGEMNGSLGPKGRVSRPERLVLELDAVSSH